MADQDISNFSSSSPHRLPTVSASQALQTLTSSHCKPISTGLQQLDVILQGGLSVGLNQGFTSGGLSKGQLTEIYGPPGVGKTTFALQLCCNGLRSGDQVLWIDCSNPVVGSRLQDILSGSGSREDQVLPESGGVASSMNELLEKLHHFIAPTLPHLLALLLHPSKNTPPEKTGLIVVDAVSTLFATAFPRATDDLGGKQTMGKLKDTKLWAANRRSSVMGDLVSKLSKVAVTRNIAILLLNQTNTKVRADTGALLRPAISGPIWEAGISCRIVLFRDWPLYRASIERQEVVDQVEEVRYAGVLKAGGIVYGDSEGVGKVVAFAITDGGLRELESVSLGGDQGSLPILPGPSLKRKRDEIADSQSEDEELGSDEEFGWMDDDIVAGEGFTKKNDNTDDEGAGSADING